MTIGEWLESRQPAPPAPLMESLKTAIGSALSDDAADTASVLLIVAERKLRELVTSGETGRAVADDLLTIDALTTYALESAAATIQSLPGFSDDAIARLSSIVPPEGDSSP